MLAIRLLHPRFKRFEGQQRIVSSRTIRHPQLRVGFFYIPFEVASGFFGQIIKKRNDIARCINQSNIDDLKRQSAFKGKHRIVY